MTIFQHTLDAVLDKRKTQTSRLWKPNWYEFTANDLGLGEQCKTWPHPVEPDDIVMIKAPQHGSMLGRTLWYCGNDYAIQPARGKRAVGRYLVTHLAKRDVRTFNDADIEREEFTSFADFMVTWCKMHDKPLALRDCTIDNFLLYGHKTKTRGVDADKVQGLLASRPASRYTAAVIRFEVLS